MYMNQEDACDTGLTLGLGYGVVGVNSSIYYQPRREPGNSTAALDASLALTLSDDTKTGEASHKAAGGRGARPSSPHSTVSSFSAAYPSSSTIKVKRENKDSTAEEAAAVEEAAASRFSDDEEEGNARKKLRLTKEQSALLEDRFKEHTTLNPKQKQALARQLNLRPRQVEVWFQNRRARTKLKQTEVDCEILKRCCEKLTDENRRLQKELHELRTLKFASPPSLYMQIPAATLTLCPSCERIGSGGGGGGDDSKGGGGGGGGGGAFVVAPKPHFFNPFAHPAAC